MFVFFYLFWCFVFVVLVLCFLIFYVSWVVSVVCWLLFVLLLLLLLLFFFGECVLFYCVLLFLCFCLGVFLYCFFRNNYYGGSSSPNVTKIMGTQRFSFLYFKQPKCQQLFRRSLNLLLKNIINMNTLFKHIDFVNFELELGNLNPKP